MERGAAGSEWRTGIGKEERRRGWGEGGSLRQTGGDGGRALRF